MTQPDLDAIRSGVLDRMEQGNLQVKWALLIAAALELVMVVVVLSIIDSSDPLQRLVFVMFAFVYMILVLGLIALGGHVTRCTDRVLAVLEARGE